MLRRSQIVKGHTQKKKKGQLQCTENVISITNTDFWGSPNKQNKQSGDRLSTITQRWRT